MSYNGWSNWETWNTYVWLSSDADVFSEAESQARDGTIKDYLDDLIEGIFAGRILEPVGGGLVRDFARQCFERIDFDELMLALTGEDDDDDEDEDDDDE